MTQLHVDKKPEKCRDDACNSKGTRLEKGKEQAKV